MTDKFSCCEDCGKKDETVRHTTCPYAEEVSDERVSIIVCSDCYRERCNDV